MALEQRIRRAVSGAEINRFRQLLVFDRFLARVFQHFVDRVVLKGGLVLELRHAGQGPAGPSAARDRAIEATFSFRATHPTPQAVPPPADDWAPVYERMARDDELPWKGLVEVHQAVACRSGKR